MAILGEWVNLLICPSLGTSNRWRTSPDGDATLRLRSARVGSLQENRRHPDLRRIEIQ